MNNIAIIPARSGSKGLKDKNIKLLNGKPLLAYTIEAAVNSGIFDKVFVSTDSEKYAEIASSYGAEAYPLRPPELSTDTVGSLSVIRYLLENETKEWDTFCLLQPTSPLRTAKHIQEAYHLFESKEADSVVSLVKSDKSPNIINKINENGTIENFIKINQKTYTRQAEEFYLPNGAIFIANVKKFLLSEDFYGEYSYPYVMDKQSSIDIDDIYDFKLVELMEEEK